MTTTQILFGFQGRLRRLHFWVWSLAVVGVAIAIGACLVFLGAALNGDADVASTSGTDTVIGALLVILYFSVLWMQLALGVKRLHDKDMSGWWMLLQLVPLGGMVLLVILGFLDGTQGPNQHGPSPKGIGGAGGARELGKVFS